MERTETHIKLWFWARHSLAVPPEVRSGTSRIHPDLWVGRCILSKIALIASQREPPMHISQIHLPAISPQDSMNMS